MLSFGRATRGVGRAKMPRLGQVPATSPKPEEFADATGILEDHAEPGRRHRRPGRDERGTDPPLSCGEIECRRNRRKTLGQRTSETRGVLLPTGSFERDRIGDRGGLRTRPALCGVEFGNRRPYAVYPVARSAGRRPAVYQPPATDYACIVGTAPDSLARIRTAGLSPAAAVPHDSPG